MRKINSANYTINARNPEGQLVAVPYAVAESMVNILFAASGDRKFNAVELMRRDLAAQAILKAKDNVVVLEEKEYDILKEAFEKFEGYSQNEVELVKRVLHAPQVDPS